MRILITLGLLAFAGSLLATALPNLKVSLSANIVTEAGAPLEYASVSALTTGSVLVDGTVTDAAGSFFFPSRRATIFSGSSSWASPTVGKGAAGNGGTPNVSKLIRVGTLL